MPTIRLRKFPSFQYISLLHDNAIIYFFFFFFLSFFFFFFFFFYLQRLGCHLIQCLIIRSLTRSKYGIVDVKNLIKVKLNVPNIAN